MLPYKSEPSIAQFTLNPGADHLEPLSYSGSSDNTSMSTTPSYDFPVQENETGRHDGLVKRKSTLRNKVSKLRKSLFKKSKGKEMTDNLQSGCPRDHLVSLPRYWTSHVSEQDISRSEYLPHSAVTEVTRTFADHKSENSFMALFIPLPASEEDEVVPSTVRSGPERRGDVLNTATPTTPTVDMYTELSSRSEYPVKSRPFLDPESSIESVSKSGFLPSPEATPKLQSTEPVFPNNSRQLETTCPKNVAEETRNPVDGSTPMFPIPQASDDLPHVSGGMTYYSISMIALAAVGICVVVLPRTYRFLRM
ncbi:hypothetical protein K439DRAFT_1020261 [Ramaria rubella]|nr:hypothetical protein K439DRAFT_1020261 [Ramaria rubella]